MSFLYTAEGVEWPLSAVAEVAQLQREVGAGRCPFCERELKVKIPATRKRVICFRADCLTEYERAYRRTPRRQKYSRELRLKNIEAGLTGDGKRRAYKQVVKRLSPISVLLECGHEYRRKEHMHHTSHRCAICDELQSA